MTERYRNLNKLTAAWQQRKALTEMKLAQAAVEANAIEMSIADIEERLRRADVVQLKFHDISINHLVAQSALREKLNARIVGLEVLRQKEEMNRKACEKIEFKLKAEIEKHATDAELTEVLENLFVHKQQ